MTSLAYNVAIHIKNCPENMTSMSKQFRSEDIHRVYKSAYNIKIPWQDMYDEEVNTFLGIFEKTTNCSKTLVSSSLLSLTSALCGPLSTVAVNENGFISVLNQYIITVCDPGGGKSNTFYRVINPVLRKIKEKHGLNIELDSYTTAGLHKHQSDNNGYGIITSDEGHRFLASINVKQAKGEGERSLLCKMCGGVGDSTSLASGSRGFSKTSMSCCLFIQPQPLLNELRNLGGDDGLMDRFLIFSAKPVFNNTQTIKENNPILQRNAITSFDIALNAIFEEHTKGKEYKLTSEAETIYDSLIDSYAELINSKYNSDHDDSKENVELDKSEDHEPTITSKDTYHILRLAAVLHVLQHALKCGLKDCSFELTPNEISKQRLKQAMELYNVLSQQKLVFTEAVSSFERECQAVRLKPVTTFRDRVAKAVCKNCGPVASLRQLQDRLKGSLAENIRIELELLERLGFGVLKSIKSRYGKRCIFFKLPPNCIDEEVGEHSKILKSVEMNIETYRKNFDDISSLTPELKSLTIQHHPQADAIDALW